MLPPMQNPDEAAIKQYTFALQADAAQLEMPAAVHMGKRDIFTSCAKMVDQTKDGAHLDINSPMGGAAMAILQRTQRRVVALIRNPFATEVAFQMAALRNRAHTHNSFEIRKRDDEAMKIATTIDVGQMDAIDKVSNDTITFLQGTLENPSVLEWDRILPTHTGDSSQLQSMSWVLPITYGRSFGHECPIETNTKEFMQRSYERTREQILRYAGIFLPENGQLVVAHYINDDVAAEAAEKTKHKDIAGRLVQKTLRHWQRCWDVENMGITRAPEDRGTQKHHYEKKDVGIFSFRRNATQAFDALDVSNDILGIA